MAAAEYSAIKDVLISGIALVGQRIVLAVANPSVYG